MIRYAIELRNGGYMKQEFKGTLELLEVRSVDSPIDADLLKEKQTAERVLNEILTGNTNIAVLYDENNPPCGIVELHIDCIKYYVGGVKNRK